ncbi:MAG: phosphate ABC transporter substrate-binding protein PstS [Terriglobales bacterium]
MKNKLTLLLAVLFFLAAIGLARAQSQALTGAGSTFVTPLMSRWAADYQRAHPGVSINYQSIGSGGGIQQVRNRTVDFGASDAAITDAQLPQMPPLVQVAEAAGPVCLIYNLSGVSQPLHLTPAAIAGLFLGTVTYWDDRALTTANPGLHLPHTPVLLTHRADGSGTTSILTTYLAAVSPEWKQRVGSGTAVNWPVGLGGKGSEGVTELVRQSPGGLGYVELAYALQHHLPVAAVQNRAGKFIAPSAAATAAALNASRAELARDVRTPIVNAAGDDSYPIAGLTFLLLPKAARDAAHQAALRGFVHYVLTGGQAIATSLGYAPLPPAVQQIGLKALRQLP